MDDQPAGEPVAPAKPGDSSGADAAEPSASPIQEPPSLATKADDLEALRAAVVDAASVGGGLWLSYLAVLAYLTIAIGGVTHKALFLQDPVKLPFLSVDLPLTSFFWLGPLLFLIMHAYVLLHFVMLADKISAFDRALVAQIGDEEVRTKLRRQLPSNIFVQFLAGPTNLRDGLLGWLLWLIATVTLAIGPVLLLLFFELQFLPYHDAGITWLQRVVVFADLLLIWKFWPAVALNVDASDIREHRRRRRALAWRRFGTRAIMLVLLVGSVPLLLLLATFPGESLEKLQPDRIPGRVWLRDRLVHGAPNNVTRRPESLFSDRLVLPFMDALPETASLRGRDLSGAILWGAVLRKADFTGASLQGATLAGASLQGARLEGASLQGATLAGTGDADVMPTSLQGANLAGASLQGATLAGASLQGASLFRASLHEALQGVAAGREAGQGVAAGRDAGGGVRLASGWVRSSHK